MPRVEHVDLLVRVQRRANQLFKVDEQFDNVVLFRFHEAEGFVGFLKGELDIDPLIVAPDGVCAVDLRLTVDREALSE